MTKLLFYPGECLKIENEDQFNQARHMLRNPSRDYEGNYPIYFEHAESVSMGSSIGIIRSPIGTWSNEPLTVVSFEKAKQRCSKP